MKKHLLTILCVVSITAMFLPFLTITVKMQGFGAGSDVSQSITGFTAAEKGILGYFLLVGPVLLIAMNYMKQLDKYKSLLAIAVPVLCIVVCIIVIIQAKSYALEAVGYSGDGSFGMKMDIKYRIAIGSILALLSYSGTAVVGAVTYHNLNLKNITFDKAGLERLKQEGTQVLHSVQGSINQAAQNVTDTVQNVSVGTDTTAAQADGSVPVRAESKPSPKKAVNMNRTEEVLAMIEKLSKMKDSGILTEEEFTEKKRQLLSEI